MGRMSRSCEGGYQPGSVVVNKRNIYLVGVIEDTVTMEFIDAFTTLDSKKGEIFVNICSEGGWVEGGFSLYDVIKCAKNKVTTIARAEIGSSAVLPFIAGDERWMDVNSRLFLHQLSLNIEGSTLQYVHHQVKDCDDFFDNYCEYIASASSNINKSEVRTMCMNETFLSSSSCLLYGFATKILEHRNRRGM